MAAALDAQALVVGHRGHPALIEEVVQQRIAEGALG